MHTRDSAGHYVIWRIRKFKGAITPDSEPYEEVVFEHNDFLDQGVNLIWRAVNGQAVTYFDNANAYIGLGDSNTAVSKSQTGLQGANRSYVGMDSGFPSISGRDTTFQATFGQSQANFAIEEFTIANGGSNSATNLNRKVQNLGTKSSNTTYQVKVTVTIN
jgi:hypothetical protein